MHGYCREKLLVNHFWELEGWSPEQELWRKSDWLLERWNKKWYFLLIQMLLFWIMLGMLACVQQSLKSLSLSSLRDLLKQ